MNKSMLLLPFFCICAFASGIHPASAKMSEIRELYPIAQAWKNRDPQKFSEASNYIFRELRVLQRLIREGYEDGSLEGSYAAFLMTECFSEFGRVIALGGDKDLAASIIAQGLLLTKGAPDEIQIRRDIARVYWNEPIKQIAELERIRARNTYMNDTVEHGFEDRQVAYSLALLYEEIGDRKAMIQAYEEYFEWTFDNKAGLMEQRLKGWLKYEVALKKFGTKIPKEKRKKIKEKLKQLIKIKYIETEDMTKEEKRLLYEQRNEILAQNWVEFLSIDKDDRFAAAEALR